MTKKLISTGMCLTKKVENVMFIIFYVKYIINIK